MIILIITQIVAKNNTYFLFLSYKIFIILLFPSFSLIIICLIAYLTSRINFFLSKFCIFSSIIQYFLIKIINYNYIRI